jgi:hypothetical protein
VHCLLTKFSMFSFYNKHADNAFMGSLTLKIYFNFCHFNPTEAVVPELMTTLWREGKSFLDAWSDFCVSGF